MEVFVSAYSHKNGILKDLEEDYNLLIDDIFFKRNCEYNNNIGYKKSLLYTNKELNFDIFEIVWYPHSETLIHDHADNGCLLRLMKGSLVEIKYNNDLIPKNKIYLQKENSSYIDNHIGLHKIQNPNDEIAISYHLYSPSGYKTKYYDER